MTTGRINQGAALAQRDPGQGDALRRYDAVGVRAPRGRYRTSVHRVRQRPTTEVDRHAYSCVEHSFVCGVRVDAAGLFVCGRQRLPSSEQMPAVRTRARAVGEALTDTAVRRSLLTAGKLRSISSLFARRVSDVELD